MTFRSFGVFCIILTPIVLEHVSISQTIVERISDFSLMIGFGAIFLTMGNKEDSERERLSNENHDLREENRRLREDNERLVDRLRSALDAIEKFLPPSDKP